jgi:proteasome lid subunit RPN8/RPN11
LLQLSHKRFRNRNFARPPPMLQLPESVYRQLRHHGETAYPHECCGVLLGTVLAHTKFVTQAVPVENASTGNTRNHYQINPRDLIRIEREARKAHSAGVEIVGFYHSHPDHPAHWSPTDLAEAHWLGCSYVITSVANGAATDTNSFHLAGSREEDKHFRTEEIQVRS